MKSLGLRAIPLFLTAVVLFGADSAEAQYSAPRRRGQSPLKRSRTPPVSPYINLAAAGGDTDAATLGYFQLTRPLQNAQRFRRDQEQENQRLESELAADREALKQSSTSSLGATGHKVQFQYYGKYYNFRR